MPELVRPESAIYMNGNGHGLMTPIELVSLTGYVLGASDAAPVIEAFCAASNSLRHGFMPPNALAPSVVAVLTARHETRREPRQSRKYFRNRPLR